LAKILNIETSTRVCSVALSIDGEIVSLHESHTKNSHAELITLFCQNAVTESGLKFTDIDAVAVSKGPGSYTGLRIGVSTAKGYCYGLDIPLISIGTLEAMAHGIHNYQDSINELKEVLYCPMIDARRMEVYAALFSSSLVEIESTSAKIIDDNSFTDYLSSNKIIFAGDGASKCKDVLSHQSNAIFIDDFHPSATYLVKMAEKKFIDSNFESTAYFEPYYLKDFVPGIPKVKGLRM